MRVSSVIICVLFAANTVFAKVIDVCKTCKYQRLQEAILGAQKHDTILLQKGFYQVQGLIINEPITILGEEGAVIDGNGKTILKIISDSVTIKNIQLQNVETNYVEDRAAIKCNNADYLILEGINVRNSFFGLLLERCQFATINNCTIIGNANLNNYLESANGNAIHLWYCKNMQISNNLTKNHRDGIYFEFVENSNVEKNHSEGNMRYGLHFMFSHHNHYSNNVFTKNGSGVAVMYSEDVIMTNNSFIENWGKSAYGLLLKDIKDSHLKNNIFKNNTIAISADNSIRIKVENNKFIQNGYALRIMGNCTDNEFAANDFSENSFDVTTNSRNNFNLFRGNYWEEYTGYDLNNDGVGDVPYRPVKLFTYIIAQSPTSLILMRSSFIDLLNLAEKVTPVLTPESLIDQQPQMRKVND